MDYIIKIILSKKFVGENWVRKNYPDFHLFIFNSFSEDIAWMDNFFLYKNNIKEIPRLDIDLNASKNIFKEGIKIISSGTDDYRHEAQIRPVLTGKSVEVFKKKDLIVHRIYNSGNIKYEIKKGVSHPLFY